MNAATVAVVGAGPAGAHLASLLARAGRKVLLLDGSGGGQKHCGGGIPARAVDDFPWLARLASPCREIRRITLLSPRGAACDLELARPLRTYRRAELDRELRMMARDSGARIVEERAVGVSRVASGWRIRTDAAEYETEYLAGADGAAGLVRRAVYGPIPPSTLSLCAGYYCAPPDEQRIVVGFLRRRGAYAWIFPRPGLASAGIVAPLRGVAMGALFSELRAWLTRSFPGFAFDHSKPYASLVATYAPRQTVRSADALALVGDAWGVAEPLTREGIYFALKSAEFCAYAIIGGDPGRYGARFAEFLRNRQRGALFARRWLCNPFVMECACLLLGASPAARKRIISFFSGTLAYGDLVFGRRRHGVTF